MNAEQAPTKPVELTGAGLPGVGSLSRKCSNCGRTGHNSRTCLEHREAAGSATTEGDVIHQVAEQHRQAQAAEKGREDEEGAASDDSTGVHHREGRKKGVAWTEEEHRLFLLGLQKLGKGDWRGISRHYVQTRSPTQVASHAQKYFIRQSVAGKRKRRSSLFDLVPENTGEAEATSPRTRQGVRVKDEAQTAQRPLETPTMPTPGFPGMVQGADPLTLAYWYQAMLAQYPMAWMHAMYGPGQQALPNMHPAAQLPQLQALGQGFIPPQLLQQGFLGVPPAAATVSQAGGVPPPGPTFAQAMLAQQQLAAALAMGAAMPFNSTEAAAAQSADTGGSTGLPHAFGLPMSRSASAMPRSEQQSQTPEPEQSQKSLSPSARQMAAREGSLHSRLFQSSAEQSTGSDSSRRPPQPTGFTRLVRPKAKKAHPVLQGSGEMPSFMLDHHEQHNAGAGASGSGESHDTATLRTRPRYGVLPSEISGSTNGGFSGSSIGLLPSALASADEQSGTLGAKYPPRPPARPSSAVRRERPVAEESHAPGSHAASKASTSEASPPG